MITKLPQMLKQIKEQGFTLIEVMVALVVVAIGLGALLMATAQNIRAYQQLKEHLLLQWADLQVANMLHLQLITPRPSQPMSQSSLFLGFPCYWQVAIQSTSMKNIYFVNIQSKMKNPGPWTHRSTTYTYVMPKNDQT